MNLIDIQTVFVAEFVRRIRSRAFIAGLLVGAFAILLMIKMPQILTKVTATQTRDFVIAADAPLAHQAQTLLSDDYTIVGVIPPQHDYAAVLKRYSVGQAIALSEGPRGLSVTVYAHDPANVPKDRIALDLAPLALAQRVHVERSNVAQLSHVALSVHPVDARFTSSNSAEAAHGIVFLMVFALYIVTLVNSQLVMASVAEEKTSRIAEMLVSAIRPSSLLTGKVLASVALAFVQLAVWIVAGAILASPGSSSAASSDNTLDLGAVLTVLSPAAIALFITLFLIGLLQLTSMFAGVASMVNRTEDIGSLSGPLIVPVIFGLIAALAALDVPNASWAVICSFIPIVSPFVLFARVMVSNVPPLEVALALAVNVAALVLIAIGSGKVYRVGLLFYGRSPSFAQVFRALRS